jgi:Holliday junction resolvase
MGRSERRKGAEAERELAQILSDELGFVVKRKLGQARDSGDDIQVGKFRIEAKRRETLALPAWCRQIEEHCQPGEVPVVAYRTNGQPWRIVLKLEDFLPLMRGELTDG